MKRPALLVLSLMCCLLAPPATAENVQGPEAPPPATAVEKATAVLEKAASPEGAAGLASLLAAIAGLSKLATERRKRIFAEAIHHGFHFAENEGRANAGPDGFDKAASALKAIDAWMLANNWRPMNPDEAALAALELKAKHGEEIAKQKVAFAAAEAVPG